MSRTDPVAPAPAGGSQTSTRKPYPWHALLQVGDGPPQGLMLRDGLVGRRVLPMQNYQAPVQEEATSDIYRERSYSWRKLSLGYGDFTQQSNGAPARYFYASNAWHAGAMRGLGPRLRQLTPAAVEGEVAGFAEAIHVTGGTPVTRLFAVAGRYIRRWEGETGAEQALSLDLGAGIVGRSWTRWTAGGPGQQDALYLTDSRTPIGHLWRYQGGAWTDLTAAGAPPAAYILATGPELWRVCGTVDQPDVPFAVSKCEGNPVVPANWTAPIEVGDASVPATGLSELQMRLFIHKADATVWALQGGIDTGTARNLTPDLRESRDPENGKRPHAWLGALYFRAGDTLWRFTGTAAERIGPERLVDNTSPVRGPVVAFCGFGAWYGLGAVYNSALASSFLVQYGNWLPGEETSPAGGAHQFVPAWDGSLCDLAGKRVTALHVTTHESVVGTPPAGGNPLLLVGFSDGTYGWLRLPRDGPSPFTPDAHLAPADYTDQPAFLRHPRHSLMAPGDVKAYLSFMAGGPVLDEARWVEAEYRVDPVGREDAWVALPGRLTQHGARVLFPEDTTGRVIDVRERYRTLRPAADGGGGGQPTWADYDALATPVVATLTIREQIRPAFRLEYAFTVQAHARVARRDGASERKTPAQIRNLLVDAAQDPGHVVLTLPDETVARFAMIEFQETVPPDGRLRRRGVAWDLGVSAIHYQTRSIYGIFDRLESTTVRRPRAAHLR